jgi:hypothetical protein
VQTLIQLFQQHPYSASIAATWLFNNVITALVGSLPAPTKDSSAKYVYWFKVSNTVIGNLRRAASTSLENSPNWKDAVAAHVAEITRVNQP